MKNIMTHNGLALGVMSNHDKTDSFYVYLPHDELTRVNLSIAHKGIMRRPLGHFGCNGFKAIPISPSQLETVDGWQRAINVWADHKGHRV